ncbi:hypothetical protein [Solibacillus cecembensis]|uniref:hypothetical protein n=1 Tax=Solibacillus cecembensis TaxID=459347 RepID=UPI003CFE2A54
MNNFKVTYYFNDEDSFVANISALNMETAVKMVAETIENKKVVVKPGSNHMWGYNLANVTKFHIS